MVLMQYILIGLAVVALANLFFQLIRQNITWSKSVKWFCLWFFVIIVAINPDITNQLANIVGIGRGADLIVYVSLIIIFLFIFRILLHLNKLERDIGKVVSEMAIYKSLKNLNNLKNNKDYE